MKRSRKYHPTPLANALGVAVLLATIVMVLFGGASAITRENIENHLSRFANYVAALAAEHGKESKFNYGDVTIEGWGRNKQAAVNNVSLEIAEKSLLDTTKWSLSTTRMDVAPDQAVFGGLYFIFGQPINVIQNSQLTMTVSSPQPFKYGYGEGREAGKELISHTIRLPSQIIFTEIKGVGDSKEPGNRVIVTYDENPVIHAKYYPESLSGNMVYHFHNIHTVSDEGSEIVVEDLSGKYDESQTPDKHFKGNYNWDIKNLSVHDGQKVIPPYNVKADISYSGEQPAMNMRSLVPSLGNNSDLTVNDFVLTATDFSLSATGHITTASNDPLPFGSMEIEINNAGNFVNSALVPDAARASLNAALQKISGQPIETQTHLVIPVKRDKGGVSYIGNFTFEELTAALLHNAFISTTKPQPVLPPAGGPTSEYSPPDTTGAPVVPAQPAVPLPPTANGSHATLIDEGSPPVTPISADGENHAIVVQPEPKVISAGTANGDSNARVVGEGR